MEGPVKDAEADNDSKEDKIVPIEEGHMDETPLDAEKGLPTAQCAYPGSVALVTMVD